MRHTYDDGRASAAYHSVRGHTLRERAESRVAADATLIGRVGLTTASVRYSATLRVDYPI
jgi:hypothetical protein